MKTKYIVEKIDWSKIKTPEEYKKALQSCEKKICYGLEEVFAYCGGRLKRGRCGYGGFDGDIEYTAIRA